MSQTPPLDAVRRELVKHIGYRERGNNDTIFNREFGRIPGYPHDGHGYPWCHTFASVGLKHGGLTPGVDFPWTASCVAGVAWFKQHGRWGHTPRVGALVYYGPGGGTHVEWVEKVAPAHIVTIGGNTSGSLEGRYHNGDGVYRKTIPRNSPRIYGYGYPDYQEKDMPLTDADLKKVANAVYDRFTHTVSPDHWAAKAGILEPGQKIDPRSAARQTWAYTKDGYARDREILARLDAQNDTIKQLVAALAARDATVDQLVAALAAQDATVDVDALMQSINAALAGVTIRLAVDPATPAQ